ncbi:universal stress protein [Salinarimonas ramus]|uniref:Universal stress protein UspA n=1 Tax=Salinarimonas ramus TaxID=690164 RepID=A0A917Q6C2_9HYPH|nr:universal stress protein [Salinarimonas ramus]GGK27997.1 universal stress protein UspA [Salinarimonas ramus]
MKTVLVPTAPHDMMDATLQTAIALARRFDSYVEGFALRPPLAEIVSVDMVMGLTWAADERGDAEAEAQARDAFQRFMDAAGLLRDAGPADGPRWRWHADAPAGDEFVGAYSRVFDITVVGRPTQSATGPRMATLESVLFEGGRPALIAPPRARDTIGETIVIAWNGSTETAHVIGMGMELLARAKRVHVLTVESGMVPGPSGEALARSLQRHGLPVEHVHLGPEKRNAGEAILEYSESVGCDLLFKGAYTQSRIRQMIFGGATSHILANATIPVFMAH